MTEGEKLVCRTKKPAEFDRYVISPSVKTFGFATFLIRGRQGARPPDISFDAFDLWASKRESAISSNRIETKNPCLLNQWRQGFVFASAAAAGRGYRPPDMSFEILNQWISKRGLEISLNRIETQNPCPLNLWGHGFVFINTAVAGSRHCRHKF